MKIQSLVKTVVAAILAMPVIAAAQTQSYSTTSGIGEYLYRIGEFINKFVIPTLLALAFFFFVWNAFRFFILGGANSEDQSKAKTLAIWGIAAFVFIVSIWGLTNVVVEALNIGQNRIICPDYYMNCNGDPLRNAVDRNGPPQEPPVVDPVRESINTQIGLPQEPPPVNQGSWPTTQ